MYEDVANIFSDDQINRFYAEETRSLPQKNIYLEEIWETNAVQNQQEYSLPTGVVHVEKVEINLNGSIPERWDEINGVQKFGNSIFFPFLLTNSNDVIRIYVRKQFQVITDDESELDIPDEATEVLVWGMVLRGYKRLVGYYRNSKNFDSVTMPNGVTLSVIQGWMRDAKTEYRDLLDQYSAQGKPKDIDLVY